MRPAWRKVLTGRRDQTPIGGIAPAIRAPCRHYRYRSFSRRRTRGRCLQRSKAPCPKYRPAQLRGRRPNSRTTTLPPRATPRIVCSSHPRDWAGVIWAGLINVAAATSRSLFISHRLTTSGIALRPAKNLSRASPAGPPSPAARLRLLFRRRGLKYGRNFAP